MFGIGMNEFLLLILLALVVIGPKRLPEVARGIERSLLAAIWPVPNRRLPALPGSGRSAARIQWDSLQELRPRAKKPFAASWPDRP